MIQLPVINCDNCGACCREQESPPGYVFLTTMLSSPTFAADVARMRKKSSPWYDDLKRFKKLSKELRKQLDDYAELRGRGEPHPRGGVCIWFDEKTGGCKHYEHRPQICRDFDVGSEGCHAWRQKYGKELIG